MCLELYFEVKNVYSCFIVLKCISISIQIYKNLRAYKNLPIDREKP